MNLLNEEGTVALKLLAELDELLLELCSQLQLLILGALKRLVGDMYIYKVSRSLYKVSRSLYKGSRSYIYIKVVGLLCNAQRILDLLIFGALKCLQLLLLLA